MTTFKINPRIPQLLGYGGLLPMLASLFGLWHWPQLADQLVDAATLYVGAIFSFLGGLQWGLALQEDTEQLLDAEVTLRLIVGVIPSLITVCALLMPVLSGGACLITGLWLLLAFEGTGGQTWDCRLVSAIAAQSHHYAFWIPGRHFVACSLTLTVCMQAGALARCLLCDAQAGINRWNHHETARNRLCFISRGRQSHH